MLFGRLCRLALVVGLVGIGSVRGDSPELGKKASSSANWPGFRGPGARGVAEGFSTPVQWDVETSTNVKWKTPIAGLGHSSPIVWGDRLFVTTCISGSDDPELRVGLYGDIKPVEDDTIHRWQVYCLNKHTGEVVWQRTACEGVPRVKRHPKATHANSTPVTDGKHVVAMFGSEGLYCYTVDGKLLWKKDLGVLDANFYRVPEAQWEYASSPTIYKSSVIVQCDVAKNSFLAAFDLSDGREIWRTPRNDVPTWGTPTVFEGPERAELIVNGFRHMGGYDPLTGKELWRMGGGADIPVPTPFVAHGLIFLTNSHSQPRPLYAVRLGATGDITLKEGEKSNDHVAWSRMGRGTYMQTPLVYGEYLYTCTDSGIFTSYDAKTGKQQSRRRIGGGGTGFTASAVAADGKLYYTGEEGDVFVFEAGAAPKLIGSNSMGEICMATPAISEGRLYFRTQRHVVCVGK